MRGLLLSPSRLVGKTDNTVLRTILMSVVAQSSWNGAGLALSGASYHLREVAGEDDLNYLPFSHRIDGA